MPCDSQLFNVQWITKGLKSKNTNSIINSHDQFIYKYPKPPLNSPLSHSGFFCLHLAKRDQLLNPFSVIFNIKQSCKVKRKIESEENKSIKLNSWDKSLQMRREMMMAYIFRFGQILKTERKILQWLTFKLPYTGGIDGGWNGRLELDKNDLAPKYRKKLVYSISNCRQAF